MARTALLLAAMGVVCMADAVLSGAASSALDAERANRAERVELSQLMVASDAIVHGQTIQLALRQDATGAAVVRVLAWLRGAPSDDPTHETITVRWDAQAGTQPLSTVETEWVLFLTRRDDGTYVGTQPDRSFWPLQITERADRLATLYRYPITLVRVPGPALLREITVISEFGEPNQVAAIALDALAAWLATPEAPAE